MTTATLANQLADYDALPQLPTSGLAEIPTLVRLSQVQPREIDWLWPGWLPKGMLTILGGYAGDGKSTITMALAAAFSTGGTLPDGMKAPVTNTLLLLAEDDLEHVVRTRLDAHGADVDRIISLTGKSTDGVTNRPINLVTDINLLRHVITTQDIGLIVIDPLSSFLSASDRNSEGDVRDSLAPLIQVLEETGVAVIAIMHVGKSDAYQRSMQRLLGSTAFTALARSVWMVVPLPDEMQQEELPTRKVLGVSKSNYAIAPTPLLFSRPLDSAVEFHGPSSMSLEDVFSWRKPRETATTGSEERDKAKAFLQSFLAGGMKRPYEIEAAAIAEGHTTRILRRAKEEMNVQSIRVKDRWYWSLPLPFTKPGEVELF
ncbi:MAG: AAA family ATPase [Thermomicrobiales bacterium]|nr:AAA family ATPase [Thermomicrobiales bacterium]